MKQALLGGPRNELSNLINAETIVGVVTQFLKKKSEKNEEYTVQLFPLERQIFRHFYFFIHLVTICFKSFETFLGLSDDFIFASLQISSKQVKLAEKIAQKGSSIKDVSFRCFKFLLMIFCFVNLNRKNFFCTFSFTFEFMGWRAKLKKLTNQDNRWTDSENCLKKVDDFLIKMYQL